MRGHHRYYAPEAEVELKGLSECPACLGVGKVHFVQHGQCSEEPSADCLVCIEQADRMHSRKRNRPAITEERVRQRMEILLNAFSGRCKAILAMSPDDIDAVYLGPAGQEYRRLMVYLWAIPADLRDISDLSNIMTEQQCIASMAENKRRFDKIMGR